MIGGYQLIDLSNYPLSHIGDGLEITDKEITSKFKVNKPKRVLFIIENTEYELILTQFDKDGVSVAKILDVNSDKWYDVVVLVYDDNVSLSFSEASSGGGGGGGGSSFPVDVFVADLKDTVIDGDTYRVKVDGIFDALESGKFVIYTNWRCVKGKGASFNAFAHKITENEYQVFVDDYNQHNMEMYINSADDVYARE